MAKNDPFDEHLDILQNIEFAIVSVYRRNRNLTDHNVDMALEALLKKYRAKKAFPPQSPLTLEVFEAARSMCDWRLGKEKMEDEGGSPVDLPIEPVS